MKRTIQLLLLLPLLWAAGCQKEASKTESEKAGITGVEVPVTIQASFSEPSRPTKAIIQGTDIPDAFEYGIFVCEHGSVVEEHKKNSWNLKATYETSLEEGMPGTWSYQYVSDFDSGALSSNINPNITITSQGVNGPTADIYAYAPYIQGAHKNGPTAIPFSIAEDNLTQVDLMYAIENMDPSENKDLDPLSAGDEPLTADFTFKHAFALLCLEFTVKNLNDGDGVERSTTYVMNNITIKNNGTSSVTKLYKSGEFDAITGDFKNCVETSSLTIQHINPATRETLRLEPGATTTAYMALVPTQIEDDDLEIIIRLNDRPVKPIKIKKADLKHADGDVYGFEGGYKYTFKFTLDNYLFLNGITVNEWETDVTDLKEVQI